MKITKKQIRDIIREELEALNDTMADGQMLENLRIGAIERLGKVLDEIVQKSSVMGVDASEIELAIRDCIERIQEPPADPQQPQ